jgi:hypothetical protein
MATSNTQRTIRELRNQGRTCAIVEKWNQHVGPYGVRQDLFGIIDILALDPERGVVGIQSCGSDFAAHERTILEDRAQESIEWLKTPGTSLELWGWRKVKLKRGGKAMRWQPRVRVFELADFRVEIEVPTKEARDEEEGQFREPAKVGTAGDWPPTA